MCRALSGVRAAKGAAYSRSQLVPVKYYLHIFSVGRRYERTVSHLYCIDKSMEN